MDENFIRIAFFLSFFFLFAFWERVSNRRPLRISKRQRWSANLSLTVLNSLCLKGFFILIGTSAAEVGHQFDFGLLTKSSLPYFLQLILGFLVLDLAVYLQHLCFHRFSLLWKLHRMHHTDLDIDVTSGTRFHPIEILLSMLIKIAVILLFGILPEVVIAFEIVLNATSMFNHSNIYIWPRLDNYLRKIVVTPDMHRIHHSIDPSETHTNFGFNLPWWDYLFRTYKKNPKKGHLLMDLGDLAYPNSQNLIGLLLQPFKTVKEISAKRDLSRGTKPMKK